MGCAPAYLALAVEALADAGADAGLDPELARELVVETTAGTAELLRIRHPADVRDAVASPGGSTEAGLEALDAEGAREAFEAAVAPRWRGCGARDPPGAGPAATSPTTSTALPRLRDPDPAQHPDRLDAADPFYSRWFRAVLDFVTETTDPYLNLFRRLVPSVGGGGFALDLARSSA